MNEIIAVLSVIGVFALGATDGTAERAVSPKTVRKLERSLLAKAPGLEKIGRTYSGYLERHHAEEITVSLEAGRCYRFAAGGGSGASDISLELRIGDKEVSNDRLSGARPSMSWCAAAEGEAIVKVTMYDGNGVFVLVVLADKKARGGTKKIVGGEGDDFTANRLRQLHARFAEGQRAHSRILRANLATGEVHTAAIRLKAGRCYTVVAAGSPSVRDLKVTVLDANGNAIAEDKSINSYPVIDSGLCPKTDGTYQLRVTMVSGSGPFGVQVFSP
jgi:hypothetical protein